MVAIHVIFDGRTFVPQQPVTLPDQSEAIVLVDQSDAAAQAKLDAEIRAYYESVSDPEDDAWAKATEPELHRAWEES
jgi:hypothetical protein